MIRETCSCGATFEVDLPNNNIQAANTWREFHKCAEPVTFTTLERSGPGLADVIEQLREIHEDVATIAGIEVTRFGNRAKT